MNIEVGPVEMDVESMEACDDCKTTESGGLITIEVCAKHSPFKWADDADDRPAVNAEISWYEMNS